jgi:heat shock protein 4
VRFQIKKNFKNTVIFPTRLMGLNTNCKEQIELEQRFMTHKIVPLDNLKIGIEVNQMGQQYQFTVEQIMGFYLTKLKKYFEKAEIMTKDVVLSIPSYCSNVERQSLLDAAEIAGLKCLRVINESTAIALNYGFFRKKMLDPTEARIGAFVDLGHSKTTVTIASFVQGKTKIICHKSDRNLGARDFDWEIMQVIGGKFAEKFGNDPRKNVRCVIRMLEAIEKARKIISSGPDSNINVDYLIDEEDLVHNLKREEFEKICDPILRRYFDLLKATVKESGK